MVWLNTAFKTRRRQFDNSSGMQRWWGLSCRGSVMTEPTAGRDGEIDTVGSQSTHWVTVNISDKIVYKTWVQC